MAEIPGTAVKQLVGKAVRLALTDGSTLAAHLLSFDGRSLWLVDQGEDRFIVLADVRALMVDAAVSAA